MGVPIVGFTAGQIPKVLRLGQGTWSPTRKGGVRPDKYWGFRIFKSWARDDAMHMPVHEKHTKALLAHYGLDANAYTGDAGKDPKTLRCPIELFSNRPEGAIHATRSVYQGGKRWCWCGNFEFKTKQWAEADGLPWPDRWPPDQATANSVGFEWPPPEALREEAYFHGMALRNDLWGPGERIVPKLCNPRGTPKWRLRCNPSACPIALGTHGVVYDSGKPKFVCKPDVCLRFCYNFGPLKGQFGYIATTGWNSTAVLAETFRIRYDQFGEWMVGVPMVVALGKEPRTPEDKTYDVPILRLDPGADMDECRAFAKEQKRLVERKDPKRLAELAAHRNLAGLLPESGDYQYGQQDEMHHEARDLPGAWEAKLRSYVAQVGGHSDSAVEKIVADAKADPEAALKEWAARLGIADEAEIPDEAEGPEELPEEPGEIGPLFDPEDIPGGAN